jgi:hypothetical protein
MGILHIFCSKLLQKNQEPPVAVKCDIIIIIAASIPSLVHDTMYSPRRSSVEARHETCRKQRFPTFVCVTSRTPFARDKAVTSLVSGNCPLDQERKAPECGRVAQI